jgi:glycosyltransferase involved in cell wall biosynthesis
MRILQLVEHLWLGGTERMAVNISNILQEDGNYVVLCPTRDKGPLEKQVNPGINLICLNKKNSFDIKAFLRLVLIIKKNKIELIHAHSSSLFWAIPVKLFYPRIRIIWHDHYGARVNDKRHNKYYRALSPFLSGVITVNETLYNWAIRNLKVKKEKITYINNFPNEVETNKSKDSEYTTIVCLANLRPEKDHLTLIKSLCLLKQRVPLIRLKVIFAGMYWEDEYYRLIRELISSCNLVDTIFIIGSVDDSASLLASADIGILCSSFEGLPLSLLEYGMAGLPVVVTDVGQCAEVIENGKFGKLVKPGDSEAIANGLLWIIENIEESEEMGEKFRQHVRIHYGPHNFLSAYNRLLDKIFER